MALACFIFGILDAKIRHLDDALDAAQRCVIVNDIPVTRHRGVVIFESGDELRHFFAVPLLGEFDLFDPLETELLRCRLGQVCTVAAGIEGAGAKPWQTPHDIEKHLLLLTERHVPHFDNERRQALHVLQYLHRPKATEVGDATEVHAENAVGIRHEAMEVRLNFTLQPVRTLSDADMFGLACEAVRHRPTQNRNIRVRARLDHSAAERNAGALRRNRIQFFFAVVAIERPDVSDPFCLLRHVLTARPHHQRNTLVKTIFNRFIKRDPQNMIRFAARPGV